MGRNHRFKLAITIGLTKHEASAGALHVGDNLHALAYKSASNRVGSKGQSYRSMQRSTSMATDVNAVVQNYGHFIKFDVPRYVRNTDTEPGRVHYTTD